MGFSDKLSATFGRKYLINLLENKKFMAQVVDLDTANAVLFAVFYSVISPICVSGFQLFPDISTASIDSFGFSRQIFAMLGKKYLTNLLKR